MRFLERAGHDHIRKSNVADWMADVVLAPIRIFGVIEAGDLDGVRPSSVMAIGRSDFDICQARVARELKQNYIAVPAFAGPIVEEVRIGDFDIQLLASAVDKNTVCLEAGNVDVADLKIEIAVAI
ncbi:hypothetical protein [Afifella aestuarii]|uniref:hypothetical protein n=1 Tax=Afifella aestuarii TaxID=1909496 RepID=UPI001FE2AC16|nr:hypothetical protein [Afifella aestuarii]